MNEFTETVERILNGSIDMHLHAGPEAHRERRMDVMEIAVHARELGMAGMVIKSHNYQTAPCAYIVSKAVPGISMYGGLTLNEEVGGLNPAAVDTAGALGAKVIWMPTFSSNFHKKRMEEELPGISILDAQGNLIPVVREILDIIKKYDMILATGHLSFDEIRPLVKMSRSKDIKTVFTHAMWVATIDQQKEVASEGALIEQCFIFCMPGINYATPQEIANAVKIIGPERCILSTDFGMTELPPAPEGMRMLVAAMLKCDLSEHDISLMVKYNPERLLGISN